MEYDLKTLQRFFSKVEKSHNCWIWKSAFNVAKYGVFTLNGKTRLAHRISYELFKGDIPKGLVIDHLCRNPSCVNPEHLEAVTDQVNILRGNGATAKNSKKTHCPKGHDLSKENILYDKKGGRRCKKCHYSKIDIYQKNHPEKYRLIKQNWKKKNREKTNSKERESRRLEKLSENDII